MMYDQERARQLPSPGPLPGRHDPRGGPTSRPLPPEGPSETRADIPVYVSLLAQSDRDRLTLRLQHALGTFVRSPHEAVDEADTAFADATTRVTAALVERRRVIDSAHRDLGPEAGTEELRLALRQYREITLRLLRM
ncbi:hypothetical protein [Streptomyces sp. NBC_01244]|uniref:hypothetical protein n=1 Tax=Streptomyces sp. NBC_01244 TaxID=2903797 RepID=UPI002E141512|nr:hypothetical protein OG247_07170 [Streptomyces sp. NBC_01244]